MLWDGKPPPRFRIPTKPTRGCFNAYNGGVILRLLISLFFILPLPLGAQIVPSLETPVDFLFVPSIPTPGAQVSVSAVNVPNPGSTAFVWRVNGAIVAEGIGVSNMVFTVGGAGSESVVRLTATQDGAIQEKTVAVRPAGLDIVWEGDTYTPPLFEVRPLPNASASLTLVAIPEIVRGGARISPNALVFRWYMGDSQTPFASGLGRSSVVVRPPQFQNPFRVSAIAETTDGLVRAADGILITPTEPSVVIYEEAPLLGLRRDRAIGESFSLVGDEATFVAFPLHIANASATTYTWSINGSAVEGASPRELTVRREGAGSGRFSVEFSLRNASQLFERAVKAFILSI